MGPPKLLWKRDAAADRAVRRPIAPSHFPQRKCLKNKD
jgi:hypothetical protein